MSTHPYTNPNDHVLRRFFDVLYEITPTNLQRVVENTPKRVRWMIVSTIAGLVLAVVLLQFLNMGIEAVEVANRPSMAERLEAPYGLSTRIVPVITVTEALRERKIPIVDQVSAAVDAEAAIDAAWAVAAEYGEHINEDWVRANFVPIVDYSYFFILPEFQGYTRSYIRNDLTAHPTIDCIVSMNPRTGDCGLTAQPTFVEAADYFGVVDADGVRPHARMTAVQYTDAETARQVLRTLSYHADDAGVLGNYAMGDTQVVSYMQGQTINRRIFAWANQNWVYMISSQDMAQIESMIGNFYH